MREELRKKNEWLRKQKAAEKSLEAQADELMKKRERLKLENALLEVLNGVLDEVLDECEDPPRI